MEMKKKFIVDVAFYTIMLALLLLGYRYILPILTPFLIGFCVASLIRLPLRRLHLKNPKHAKLMAALLCAVFYVVIVGLLVLLGMNIVSEIRVVVMKLPDWVNNTVVPFAEQVAVEIQRLLGPVDQDMVAWILEMGQNATYKLVQYVTDFSAAAVRWVANSAVSLPGLIINIILTVVSTFYFAADYHLVLDFAKKVIPEKRRQGIVHAVRYAQTAVVAFLKSYSIMFAVTFVELSIGLSLLQIPYAVAISFGIAVFDLMPVLGVGGILLPWSAVLVVLGNYPLALGILLLYLVIVIIRNTLEPRIVGERIGLHPLATLIAMILGLNLAGLIGMLFFPITLVALTNFRKTAQKAAEAGQKE